MTEFKRDYFLNDPVFKTLYELIRDSHTVAEHTQKVILDHKDIKDFCEEARHFIVMPGKNYLYLHYDVATWFKEPNGVRVVIDSIGVYDNEMEYEIARLKQLHGAEKADIPNLN